MFRALTEPGKRKAAGFAYIFWFTTAFMAIRMAMPFFVQNITPLDDIPQGVQLMYGTALGLLVAGNTVAKFSPAVKAGKEPA